MPKISVNFILSAVNVPLSMDPGHLIFQLALIDREHREL